MSEDLRARYAAVAAALRDLSDAYYRAGKLTEALRVADAGVGLLRASGDSEVAPADRARMAAQRAFILAHWTFYNNSRYDEAQAASDNALELARATDDALLIASALDLGGQVHYNRVLNGGESDYTPALEAYGQALALRRRIADTRGTAESLFHIGVVAEQRGESEAARVRYEEALAIATAHGHRLEESYVVRHLAGLRRDAGDAAGARQGFERSLALRESLGYTILVPLARVSLGDDLAALGDGAGAEVQYLQASDLAATMEIPLARAFAHLSLGTLYQRQGDIAQAREWLERALAEAQALGLSEGIQAASAALAEIPAE